jgi:cobalt-zinc-cadmium efflux system protein
MPTPSPQDKIEQHGHEHGHTHGHSHSVSADADRRYLRAALALILGFMAVEVIVGFLASSLALISDAGHMLTDAGALVLALVAMRLAARPAEGVMTYGFKRAEILSAQANGLTLLGLSLLFYYEGVRRFIAPPVVEGGLVLVVGLLGIGVNLLASWFLAKANRQSLNIEGSFQHILTDLYAFIATSLAGGIIYFTGGYYRLDAVAALLIATLMLRAGYGLVKEAGRIFLEAAPKGMDPAEIGAVLAAQPEVVSVHDLHVWEIASSFPTLSAHVLVTQGSDCHAKRRELEKLLIERFDIHHSTLQMDHDTPQELERTLQKDARGEGLNYR